MHNPNADESPFNSVPLVVVALAMLMAAMEIVFQAGEAGFVGGPQAIGWRLDGAADYGVIPALWTMMVQAGQYDPVNLMRFVTYPFIHGSFTHAAFAIVILLAIGKYVGEIFAGWAVLVVFFGSAIAGGFVYAVLSPVTFPLIGGYPSGYGLIGAYTFVLWVSLAAVGDNTMRAFTLIGLLLAVQLVFGILFGAGYDWIADVTGFMTGFLLSFVVSPGGWQRVLAKMRRD